MSTPYDYKVLIEQPSEDAPCHCGGGCSWEGHFKDLAEITDCSLTPGDPSPAGRCPDCDSLAYLGKLDCLTGKHKDTGRGICAYCDKAMPASASTVIAPEIARVIDAAHDSLAAWDNEEDSVQDEHRSMIRELRNALDALPPSAGPHDTPKPGLIIAMLIDALNDCVAELEDEISRDSEASLMIAAVDKATDAIREALVAVAHPPRLAVVLEGGMVQDIISDKPDFFTGVDVLVIDYDDEGADEADLTDVPQDDGSVSDAIVTDRAVNLATIDLAVVSANLDAKGA